MRTYKKVFEDKEKLKEMLKLRAMGYSSPALAKKYKVDHSSILRKCSQYKIKPGSQIITINGFVWGEKPKKIKKSAYRHEKIKPFPRRIEPLKIETNLGKSYQDYLDEYVKKRKIIRDERGNIVKIIEKPFQPIG